MPEALGTLGSLFSNSAFPAIASGATAATGEIGNLLAGADASKQQKLLQNQEKYVNSLTPGEITQQAVSAEAPINQGLVQQISNQVSGNQAERGLAQAPGIFAANESQALAPIEQANFQTALQQVMTKLGLPLQYAQTIAQFLPKQANMTPAFQLFLQQLQKLQQNNASAGNQNSGITTGPTIDQLGPPPTNLGDTGTTGTDPFAGVSSLLGTSS